MCVWGLSWNKNKKFIFFREKRKRTDFFLRLFIRKQEEEANKKHNINESTISFSVNKSTMPSDHYEKLFESNNDDDDDDNDDHDHNESPHTPHLYKYPVLTPKLHSSDDYFKSRKKISPFKQIANLTPSFWSNSPHITAFRASFPAYFRVFFKYILLVAVTLFVVLFFFQAYKSFRQFNLSQRGVHTSWHAFSQNVKHLKRPYLKQVNF